MDVRSMIELMQDGMIETVKIFFFTLIFTLPLGMFVAFGRMSKFKIIRYLFKFYILQLFFFINCTLFTFYPY